MPRLDRLDVDSVERHVAEGRIVIDVRPIAEFARGHIPGSISIALRPGFASWLGWLTGLDEPIAIVADDGQDRYDLVRQCLDIGHDALVGELDGGIAAWRTAGGALAALPLVPPADAAATVVDVRQRNEYESGHVAHAVNIELGSLATTPVPDGPVTVMCGHGERAMSGASILAARGHRDVTVLDGGPDTWAAEHGELLAVGR